MIVSEAAGTMEGMSTDAADVAFDELRTR